MYALRITTELSYEELKGLFVGFTDMFGVIEYAENRHFHFIFKSPLKLAGIRNRFGKSSLIAKNSYSVKDYNGDDDMLLYMCKGTTDSLPEVVVNDIGLNIQESHKKYWDNNKVIKSGKGKTKTKSVKEIFLQWVEDRQIVIENVNQVKFYCCEFYIWYSAKYDKGFNDFVIISFVWKMKSYYAMLFDSQKEVSYDIYSRISDKC